MCSPALAFSESSVMAVYSKTKDLRFQKSPLRIAFSKLQSMTARPLFFRGLICSTDVREEVILDYIIFGFGSQQSSPTLLPSPPPDVQVSPSQLTQDTYLSLLCFGCSWVSPHTWLSCLFSTLFYHQASVQLGSVVCNGR